MYELVFTFYEEYGLEAVYILESFLLCNLLLGNIFHRINFFMKSLCLLCNLALRSFNTMGTKATKLLKYLVLKRDKLILWRKFHWYLIHVSLSFAPELGRW